MFASGIQIPPDESKFHLQIYYLETGIHGVESRIQDYLGLLYMGRTMIRDRTINIINELKYK